MNKIIVVGSINVDIVNRVDEYPVPGQTIKSEGTAFYYGGKGANQAVAAARAGGNVSMIGAVGTDPYAKEVSDALQGYGVDTAGIVAKTGTTGMAFITVNAAGQNQIILAEGANGRLQAEDARNALQRDGVRIVLLQNEIPWDTNLAVLHWAKANGVRALLNPAPALRLSEEDLPLIGTLVLNESEAEAMTGRAVGSKEDAVSAASELLLQGVEEVIVTLGAAGALYRNRRGESMYTPAFPVKAVDTTSAGDTFIGYYASRIAMGASVEEALRFASAAAALSVTKNGAQASIPEYGEVEHFIKTR